jgi:heat shock protein HtpX
LAGANNMIAALDRLEARHETAVPGQLAASGITGGFAVGLRRLFLSHPPIVDRIEALRSRRYV